MSDQVIITGASGVIGRSVIERLSQADADILAIGRTAADEPAHPFRVMALADAERRSSAGVSSPPGPTLVHAAGISGRAQCSPANMAEAAAFASASIELAHARAAEKAILLSSIYATLSERGRRTPYGDHKLQVEALFRRGFRGRLIVLRLPPVYGGELDSSSVAILARLVARGVPLPLRCAKAERDYLAMTNLAELIARIVAEPVVVSKTPKIVTYEPSDGLAVSTRQLARYLGDVVGRPVRLIPVPDAAMRAVGSLIGRRELVSAAFTPLRTESPDRLFEDFGWKPAIRMPRSLDYLGNRRTT